MKKIISILFLSILAISAFAQSADVITEILETKEAKFGQICYISAVQQNLVSENTSYYDAVRILHEKKQLPQLVDENEVIPVIDIAYLFSYMWNIKGGLMFRITGGAPRYVFRQLQSDGIIGASVDPKSTITGAEALSMYTSCLRKYGDFDITTISMDSEEE